MLNLEKLNTIESVLAGKVTALEIADDLTPAESEILTSSLNVKFKASNGGAGCFCYYSSKPGAGGFGKTHLEAFCYLLKRLEFKRNSDLSLDTDLKIFFDKF